MDFRLCTPALLPSYIYNKIPNATLTTFNLIVLNIVHIIRDSWYSINISVYVLHSFLDNRYRTTLLSFHLNRNLISKIASRFMLFTLFCITYLHRREMNLIGFLFQFFTSYQMPYNVKVHYFQMCVAVSFVCSSFLPASHYKTDLIQTIKNSTALQLSGL